MQKLVSALMVVFILLVASCGTPPAPTPTLTLAPPASALASPTLAPLPTSTSIPPTATRVPPTATATSSPTLTSRNASVKEITNRVDARVSADRTFATATIGQVLNVGGQARTGSISKTRLDFSEGTIVRLGENTILTVEELSASNSGPLTRFQMEVGKIWIALFGGVMEIKTPAGVATVRGSFATLEVFSNGDVVFFLVGGSGGWGTMNLTTRQGLKISQGGQVMRHYVTDVEVLDFADNNPESCISMAHEVGISVQDFCNYRENMHEPKEPSAPPPPPPKTCLRACG